MSNEIMDYERDIEEGYDSEEVEETEERRGGFLKKLIIGAGVTGAIAGIICYAKSKPKREQRKLEKALKLVESKGYKTYKDDILDGCEEIGDPADVIDTDFKEVKDEE